MPLAAALFPIAMAFAYAARCGEQFFGDKVPDLGGVVMIEPLSAARNVPMMPET